MKLKKIIVALSVCAIFCTTLFAQSNIVNELRALPAKLIQESSTKPTYAFVALTSDDGNALVENYVTDLLMEAMLNTGKVKIVERANIEKIMSEQKFQNTALLNENTAVEIGNLSGANYVCYGTVKDLGAKISLNVKVVEVSTAELCAMGRETVNKDEYLNTIGYEGRPGEKVASNKEKTNATQAETASSGGKGANTQNDQKPKLASAWTVQKKANENYTSYLFISKGPGDQFLFVGYDKYNSVGGSCVRAGVHWTPLAVDVGGTYDVKEDNGAKETKEYSWAWWSYDLGWGHEWAKYGAGYLIPSNGWYPSDKKTPAITNLRDSREKNDMCFAFSYNKGESARFWVERIDRNNFVAVKHNNENFRFQTASFWDTVAEQGLTREEIMDAIANDEF